MTPDAVQALARVALIEIGPDEARAIAAALAPLVAQIAASPADEGAAEPGPPGRPASRADVPGPALTVAAALAGAATVRDGLVVAARFREDA